MSEALPAWEEEDVTAAVPDARAADWAGAKTDAGGGAEVGVVLCGCATTPEEDGCEPFPPAAPTPEDSTGDELFPVEDVGPWERSLFATG
ncbi:MAG: hypothetical protein ACOYMG_29775 [Candidatus Methylumidiphilus sp.]